MSENTKTVGKHTPGPWEVYSECLSGENGDVCVAYGAYASSFIVDNPADISLIEAAPELLEALKQVRKDLNWMLNNRQFLNDHVFDYIDEVIKKAEGEK